METLGYVVLIALVLTAIAVIFVVARAANLIRKTSVTIELSTPSVSVGNKNPIWEHRLPSQGPHEVNVS